jgi:predicted nucleic acid-binding protein
MPLRAIIDTNVFLSSLWSSQGAAFIVTRNLGHLKPAESLGVEVLTPAQFLAKLKAGI